LRLTALLLLLLAFVAARASDVLVLIDPADAGPRVPTSDYMHPLWMLWPHESGKNQLMSLPSGMDWRAQLGDDFFDETGHALAAPSLTRRGYFQAVHQYLRYQTVAALPDRHGNYAPSTLQAALTAPQVQLAQTQASLQVTTVSGPHAWDDMADIARHSGGKVMVVELPTKDGVPWSRIWLKGDGWPDGLPILPSTRIPGLIPAREALNFFADPSRVEWEPNEVYRWGGANRWLEYGHFTVPVFLVFVGVVAIYIAGCAVYCIVREERGRIALFLLRALVLGPAILILGGRFAAHTMVNGWPQWLLAGAVCTGLAAYATNLLAARYLKTAHPLFGEMWIGFCVCALVDPVWSVFSQTLGFHQVPISPEAFASLCTYAVAWIAFSRQDPNLDLKQVAQWAVMAAPFVLIAPIAAVAIGAVTGLKKHLPLLTGALLLTQGILGKHGLTYAANDLYASLKEKQAVNLADHVAFVSSPAFIGFALFVLIVWIAGDRFLTHQIRRSLTFNRQPIALAKAAAVFLPLGIVEPPYLYAALACAMAAATCTLFDAVRAP